MFIMENSTSLNNMHAMQSAFNRLYSAVDVLNQVVRHFTIDYGIRKRKKLLQELLYFDLALRHIRPGIQDLYLSLQAPLQTYITPTIM